MRSGLFFLSDQHLSFDSAVRAGSFTGSAVNAGIRIDHIFVFSLRDCAYRTLTFAGSAANAFICNFMCHY